MPAVAASSFLPFWSSPEPYTSLRGAPAYDGGFTQPLPCPPNATYCVRVQAQPYGDPPTEQARAAPLLSTATLCSCCLLA